MEGIKGFRQRVRSGEISRQDVRRLLAELACGKVNDCVRLALEEDSPRRVPVAKGRYAWHGS